MIRVEHQKVYSIKLEITNEDKEIFTLCEGHNKGVENNKHFEKTAEIFEWIRLNTRKFCPYKVKNETPSFRLNKVGNNKFILSVSFALSNEEVDLIF